VRDAYSTAYEIGSRDIPFRGKSSLFWIEVMVAVSLGLALGIAAMMKILSPG